MGSFKDVVGHNDIITYIQNSIANDQVSHAYIINGERGSGKKLLAKLFAMTLQCEEHGKDPCNLCHSCVQAQSNNHPDIIWVNHASPNLIKVQEVREQVVETVEIRPYQSPYKVYIIPQADLMNEQAQNAILKSIEEPPEYVVFLLLTDNAEKLLPTIRSRCIMLKLRNIKDELIRKYLAEKLGADEQMAAICAAYAQGNLGKAIALASSDHFNAIRDEVLHLMNYIHDMKVAEIVEAVKRSAVYKVEVEDYLDLVTVWYRDVLLYKATKDIDKLVFSDQISAVKEQAKQSSYEGLELILESIEKAKARLKANVNFELTMELLFLTIKEN